MTKTPRSLSTSSSWQCAGRLARLTGGNRRAATSSVGFLSVSHYEQGVSPASVNVFRKEGREGWGETDGRVDLESFDLGGSSAAGSSGHGRSEHQRDCS